METNKKIQINESLLSFENVLMAAGFVPVIGEIADIALIIYYLVKGEKLYAALMLIALIPTVGDFIVKPIIKALKVTKEGGTVLKGGVELSEYLAKNPEMAKKFASLSRYTKSPEVIKTVENIGKVNRGWGNSLKTMLDKIGGSAIKGVKAGSESVIAGKSFSTGLKDFFKGERLTKYFAKHGVLPEKGISMWWQKVLARQDRKNAFRKFIAANNLLSYFGVPSLTTFENKLSNDSKFRSMVANDPKISEFISQNSTDQDFLNNNEVTTSATSSGLGLTSMSLPTLKKLAQIFV